MFILLYSLDSDDIQKALLPTFQKNGWMEFRFVLIFLNREGILILCFGNTFEQWITFLPNCFFSPTKECKLLTGGDWKKALWVMTILEGQERFAIGKANLHGWSSAL